VCASAAQDNRKITKVKVRFYHVIYLRYTPVKKVPNSKYSLSCRLFDVNVVCNGGYYSLVSENAQQLNLSFNAFHCRERQSVRP